MVYCKVSTQLLLIIIGMVGAEFQNVPPHAFLVWCLGTGTTVIFIQDLLCCQVSGGPRSSLHPSSTSSTLSVTSLSLPSEVAAAPPVRNKLCGDARASASRRWTPKCRHRNLSALDPPLLTCSRLHLAARLPSKHGLL